MLEVNAIQSNSGSGVSIKPALSLDELRATTAEHCIENNVMRVIIADVVSEWIWNATSVAVDNDTDVVKATAIQTGRWLRLNNQFLNDPGTVSQAEAEAGIATTVKMWTAQRVKQAFSAFIGTGFDISLTENGYIKLPTALGGLVVQWGISTVSSETSATVTFPIAFPTNVFNIQGTVINDTPEANATSSATVKKIGLTTFTLVQDQYSGGTYPATQLYWMAIGN